MATISEQHNERIVDQFSKQSIPFTKVPGHFDAVETLIACSNVKSSDIVLDVACGPGIVACEFAKKASKVVGIDFTPAMIKVAETRQVEQNLNNLEWRIGDANQLPFDDGSFDVVVTRYSFHHLLKPAAALREMIRVCKPNGIVLVADVAIADDKSAYYDKLETLRDPSHVHALTETEFEQLFRESGLRNCSCTGYPVTIELEALLSASFPNPGDCEIVSEMITKDLEFNNLGINVRSIDKKIVYSVPILVYVGKKA